VIRDIAASAGFVDLDAARAERFGVGHDVRAAAVSADAERDDVGMLHEEEQVADPAGAAIFDERTLLRERVGVRHHAEMPHFDRSHFRFQSSD
jgi:hypothetical protein